MSVLCYLVQKTVAGEILVEVYNDYSSQATFKSKDDAFVDVPVITVNVEGKQFILEYCGRTYALAGGPLDVGRPPHGAARWSTCSEELKKALVALLLLPIKRIVVIRPGYTSTVWDIDSKFGAVSCVVMASTNSAGAMLEAKLQDGDALAIVSETKWGTYLVDITFSDKCVSGHIDKDQGKFVRNLS